MYRHWQQVILARRTRQGRVFATAGRNQDELPAIRLVNWTTASMRLPSTAVILRRVVRGYWIRAYFTWASSNTPNRNNPPPIAARIQPPNGWKNSIISDSR